MSETKTGRLLNLLIALLTTERGIAKERILRDIYDVVPGAADLGSVERKFERDKAQLRAMGALIEEREGYERMDSAEQAPLYRIRPEGYRLPALSFSAEEFSLLALAGLAWDDAASGSEARAALRRLETGGEHIGELGSSASAPVQPRLRADDPHWEALREASARRSVVSFRYVTGGTGQESLREVEPWGLGLRFGQWYLVGRDVMREAPRIFRLSRMRGGVTVSGERDAFPPAPRGAVSEKLDALTSLPTISADLLVSEGRALTLRQQLAPASGEAPAGWDRLRYEFVDVTVAAEQLAAFGDAVVVLGPLELREAVGRRLKGALEALDAQPAEPVAQEGASRKKTGAEDRLRTLAELVPFLLRGPATIGDIAARFEMSESRLLQELDLLRYSGPVDSGGFQDFIDVSLENGIVSLGNAAALSRPQRLSVSEALALQVGLRSLTPLVGGPGAEVLASLEEKVARAASLGAGGLPEVDVQNSPARNAELLPVLREAIDGAETLLITYVNPSKDERTERWVNPFSLGYDGDRWYVRAYCHLAEGLRSFRVDRIETMEAAERRAVPPDVHGVESVLFDPAGASREFVARLAPEALWLEREHRALSGQDLVDGSRRVRFGAADFGWVPGFAAQFGGSVVIEGPEELREASRAWLSRALSVSVGLSGFLDAASSGEQGRG